MPGWESSSLSFFFQSWLQAMPPPTLPDRNPNTLKMTAVLVEFTMSTFSLPEPSICSEVKVSSEVYSQIALVKAMIPMRQKIAKQIHVSSLCRQEEPSWLGYWCDGLSANRSLQYRKYEGQDHELPVI